MQWYRSHKLLRVVGLLCFTLFGCKAAELSAQASFKIPMAMAISNGYLFVANNGEDALQVVKLNHNLEALDLVRSPAYYFSLRVPAGHLPMAVGSVDDNYLVVLDAQGPTLRLIDTQTLKEVVDTEGQPVTLELSSSVAASSMIVGKCSDETHCQARIWVLHSTGITSVSLDNDVSFSTPSLVPLTAPVAMALSPDDHSLFVAHVDSGNTLLTRFDVSSSGTLVAPVLFSDPIKGVVSTLAISRDGSYLLAGRPEFMDVVVITDIQNTGVVQSSMQAYLPAPQCYQNNTDGSGQCVGAHPADLLVERDVSGTTLLVDENASYDGLYLGLIPQAITTLESLPDGNGTQLTVRCYDSTGQPEELIYDQFALIAGMDGTIGYVGLRDGKYEVIDTTWCKNASFVDETQTAAGSTSKFELKNILSDVCVEALDGSSVPRFQCIKGSVPASLEVALSTGADPSELVEFEWEGVLDAAYQRSTGGQLLEDGSVLEVPSDMDLEALGVQPDDWVQVTSGFLATAECLAYVEKPCNFERRIKNVDARQLRLDTSLPADCLDPTEELGFQIRVGNGFVVRADGHNYRLAPGQRFGLGGSVGQLEPYSFSLKSDIAVCEHSACECYEDSGKSLQHNVPSRKDQNTPGDFWGFRLNDPFRVSRAGILGSGTVGRMPASLIQWLPTGQAPVVFVSYAGSDAIYAFFPHDINSLTVNGNFKILQ